MKLFLKRSLSLVLVLVLVLTATPLATTPAQAATVYKYLFPVKNGKLAYVFGYSASYGGYHNGIDIHSKGDDTIYAACDGTVLATANSCTQVSKLSKCAHYSTYGNYIKIKNSDGTIAYYGHLKINTLKVSKGSKVKKGQAIATMGSSGYSSGKHLHFELRKSNGSTKINVNPTSQGGSMNYSYSGYADESDDTYTSVPSSKYYIKSKYNGGYMNVAYGKDADKTDIHTHTFGNWDSQIYTISQIKKGYEHQIQPKCSSSRVVNPYADTVVSGKKVNLYHKTNESSQWWYFKKVSGGYAICNAQNPNVCITVAKSSTMLTVETYTGASNQIWVLEKQCKLSYNANGGSGAPSTTYVRSGYSQKLSTSKPKRSGYTFLGWSTSKSATKATYKAGASVTIKKDTTLYAVWQKNKATASAVVYKIKSTKLSTTSYTYNGKAKTPSVTVKNTNGTTLKNNTDYTVTYASGRKNVGKYKVTVKGKGKYSGTYTLYFTIKPKGTTVSKLTAGKKSLKVSIKKQSSQTSGYQIQYSTSKKFTSAKTTTITSYKTTSKTIKSLKAKKTYYVRVRTYKTVNGTKYYSGWSAAKSKKTK